MKATKLQIIIQNILVYLGFFQLGFMFNAIVRRLVDPTEGDIRYPLTSTIPLCFCILFSIINLHQFQEQLKRLKKEEDVK